MWIDDKVVGLGSLAKGDLYHSFAEATSADGSVIVGSTRSALSGPEGWEACIWTDVDEILALGDLPGGDYLSIAYSVSADGKTVVGKGSSELGVEAIIWDAQHGLRSLASMLCDDYGLSSALEGWTLSSADGISADGLTITGYGWNPDGQSEGWVVHLPEPSTFWLLLAIAAAGHRRHA